MRRTESRGRGLGSGSLTPGRSIALRELIDRTIWTATPATVVEDTPELVALHTPAGAKCQRPVLANGEALRLPLPDRTWILREERWLLDTLRLVTPGTPHSVQLHWSHSPRRLQCWYINLEAPLRRTPLGFDFFDHIVDIVVSPDRKRWEWKDLDELDEARAHGLVDSDEVAARIAEGERALDRLRIGAPPFDGSWELWCPDPRWSMPSLPAGWDAVG